ncbi:MAG: 3-phosphoshikimate 1-carboxyvinyltransferase [Lachnospiraceae bacterium]|nr:3-phosphoshikimate 1-carboxyvinyltransferase [Lachnospiraceae bacterium]
MIAKIKKSNLKGCLKAVPSKSFLHRMLICAALSEGRSRIGNVIKSEDILASIDCIRSLGAEVIEEGDSLMIRGIGRKMTENAAFPCRESGSTLRFFIPVAAALCEKATFTGSERLMERGIGIYEDALGSKGIKFSKEKGDLNVEGKLISGIYEIPGNISSQYITGLLFALPLLGGDSEIRVLPPVESRPYIDITISVLKLAGIEVEEPERNRFLIKGNSSFRPLDTDAEGDWSNAAFLYAMNGLGAEIEVSGLNGSSVQGDRICVENFKKLDKPHETIDIGGCIDLGPVLFAYASAKNGGHFTGTERLKIKESDRAAVMAEELLKFGVKAEIKENEVIIPEGGVKAPTKRLDSHNDHRIVMALTVLLMLTGGEIGGIEAVRKSYPGFFEDLRRIGLDVEINEG